jgi:hypothetical protein
MRLKWRVFVASFAVVVVIGWQAVFAQVVFRPAPRCQATTTDMTPGTPEETFEVDFQGIISIVKQWPDSNYRKAIVITSGLTLHDFMRSWRTRGMNHEPLLVVRSTVDRNSLAAATGRKVTCTGNRCTVPLRGLAFRISGYKNGVFGCPRDIGSKFDEALDSLPRLSRLKELNLVPKSTIFDDAVNSPERAIFVLEGGNGISAEPFLNQAGVFFKSDGQTKLSYYDETGTPSTKCRSFANVVAWKGRTDGPAVLEVNRSGRIDNDKWVTVSFYPTHELLWVGVENLSSPRVPSPKHFDLFGRLMTSSEFPIICPCDAAGNPICPKSGQHVMMLFGGVQAVPENAVPGCSDTGWP